MPDATRHLNLAKCQLSIRAIIVSDIKISDSSIMSTPQVGCSHRTYKYPHLAGTRLLKVAQDTWKWQLINVSGSMWLSDMKWLSYEWFGRKKMSQISAACITRMTSDENNFI